MVVIQEGQEAKLFSDLLTQYDAHKCEINAVLLAKLTDGMITSEEDLFAALIDPSIRCGNNQKYNATDAFRFTSALIRTISSDFLRYNYGKDSQAFKYSYVSGAFYALYILEQKGLLDSLDELPSLDREYEKLEGFDKVFFVTRNEHSQARSEVVSSFYSSQPYDQNMYLNQIRSDIDPLMSDASDLVEEAGEIYQFDGSSVNQDCFYEGAYSMFSTFAPLPDGPSMVKAVGDFLAGEYVRQLQLN